MEIRRFGTGNRRREGLAGARRVSGQPIHNDARGNIAELAFASHASVPGHSNPNTTWFIVIEGGGFVQVGDERARVAAGEAVLWPANVVHAAWTEHSPMRALVVEFSDEPADVPLLVEGHAEALSQRQLPDEPSVDAMNDPLTDAASDPALALRADGALAPRPEVPRGQHESPEKEPW